MNVIPYKASFTKPITARPLWWLSGGQLIAALAGLVYGKLTARYVPPAVWGTYNLVAAGLTLLQGLLLTPTLQSFKAALNQFAEPVVVGFYVRLLCWLYVGLCPIGLVAGWLSEQLPVAGMVWLTLAGQGGYQLGTDWVNVRSNHRTYALTQAAYALGNLLTFGLIVVGLLHRSAPGLWLTTALLNVVFAVLNAQRLYRTVQRNNRFNQTDDRSTLWRSYRRYVAPLLSLAGWSWLINYADRYLIGYYLTDADVGYYVMGYGLGSKLLLLVAPLISLLTPQVLRLKAEGQSEAAANALLLPYLIRYGLVAGAGCMLFYVVRDWGGRLLLTDTYQPAFGVGPIIAGGYLFLTAIHLLEIKWYAFGTTRYVLWHTLAGVVLHVGLNVLLIPRWGIDGAAFATLLGFAGQFALALWFFTLSKPIHS